MTKPKETNEETEEQLTEHELLRELGVLDTESLRYRAELEAAALTEEQSQRWFEVKTRMRDLAAYAIPRINEGKFHLTRIELQEYSNGQWIELVFPYGSRRVSFSVDGLITSHPEVSRAINTAALTTRRT